MNTYEPILIRQGRMRNAFILLLTSAITVGAVWLLLYQEGGVLMDIAAILFFGVIGIPALTWNTIKPGYLLIDENGFEFDNVNARKVRIGWDQITSIQLINAIIFKCVYIRCVPGSQRLMLTILGMPGYSAKKIVEIMLDYGWYFYGSRVERGH